MILPRSSVILLRAGHESFRPSHPPSVCRSNYDPPPSDTPLSDSKVLLWIFYSEIKVR